MILYAESSAVLAWLLGEKAGEQVRSVISDADFVVGSDLTLIECDRAIRRGAALGAIDRPVAADLKSRLESTACYWQILRILPEIVTRARQTFPDEPIRTLDAIHVASALHIRAALPGITLLTLDARIRKVGLSLGLPIAPA
jgi:predicted nucleic acid-binding protein